MEASTNELLNVPLIPKSFINKFEETFTTNPITEVKLDYFFFDRTGNRIHYDKRADVLRYSETGNEYLGIVDLNTVTVAVRKDRTVIPSTAAKKVFTLEEVQKIASGAHTLGRQDLLASQAQGKYVDTFNEWFIEQI